MNRTSIFVASFSVMKTGSLSYFITDTASVVAHDDILSVRIIRFHDKKFWGVERVVKLLIEFPEVK